MLSFALREGQLDMTAVHTLMRGYQTVYPYFGHRFYRHHRQGAERGGPGDSDIGKKVTGNVLKYYLDKKGVAAATPILCIGIKFFETRPDTIRPPLWWES